MSDEKGKGPVIQMVRKGIREVLPDRLRRAIRYSPLFVSHRSTAVNVYHCTVQRTASRWLRGVLSDVRVHRFSGLRPYDHHARLPRGFDPRPLTKRPFEEALPRRRLVTPLYVGYSDYRSIPKPETVRTFFVMLDPRDIVTSWYFAMKKSHKSLDGALTPIREELNRLGRVEGMLHAIDLLEENTGMFEALGSWVSDEARKDEAVLLIRFEDITGDGNFSTFRRLMDHCDIAIPDDTLSELLEDHSFERLTGRSRGDADEESHMRKGVHGDWRNHFTDEIQERFREATGDLVRAMGYREIERRSSGEG